RRHRPSFPTRRSSDLEDEVGAAAAQDVDAAAGEGARQRVVGGRPPARGVPGLRAERPGDLLVRLARERRASARDRRTEPEQMVRSEEHTSELQSPYDL